LRQASHVQIRYRDRPTARRSVPARRRL
jgi:hypothetical protein